MSVYKLRFPKAIQLLLFAASIFCLSFTQGNINGLMVEFRLDDSVENASLPPKVLFNIRVIDTTGIEKVMVRLGTTPGGHEHFNYSLSLDGSNVPQGINIEVENNSIIIDTGNRSGVVKYYATAKLQYRDGSFSEVKTINN